MAVVRSDPERYGVEWHGAERRGAQARGGRVCVGRIVAAHGLKGEFSVRSFTADPDAFTAYGPLSVEGRVEPLRLRVVGRKKDALIARADGVANRTAAEALSGTDLFVERAALPKPGEDEFYYADLIGLAADLAEHAGDPEGTSGPALGWVLAVHEFGAGPVLEIGEDGSATAFVPFSKEAVPQVDLAAGRLIVAPLPGLFDARPAEDVEADANGEARP